MRTELETQLLYVAPREVRPLLSAGVGMLLCRLCLPGPLARTPVAAAPCTQPRLTMLAGAVMTAPCLQMLRVGSC